MYKPGNDFELIPIRPIEMETRNPVEGYFGSEFPAICNHRGVMAGLKSQDVKKSLRYFCIFLEKQSLMVKFSKFCFESFHRDTVLCSHFVKLAGWKSMKSCVAYLTKNRLTLKLSLLLGSHS